MQLSKVEDHRDCLEKATRWEITQFAAARGVSEIDPRMGAILMRQLLRAKNITDIDTLFPHLRRRVIGQQRGVNATNPLANQNGKVAEVDATQDLMRQWREQQAHEIADVLVQNIEKAKAKMENPMAALRKECKRLGIKMSRTDKIADLRAKLDGEQDAT